jgi:transcriptional regulator GlxA family with amidase domain
MSMDQLGSGAAVLVLPGFNGFNFSAIADICFEARQISSGAGWQLEVLSHTGGSVPSAGRVVSVPTGRFRDKKPCRLLFVVLGDAISAAEKAFIWNLINDWIRAGSHIVLIDGFQSEGLIAGMELGRGSRERILQKNVLPTGWPVLGTHESCRLLLSAGGLATIDDAVALIVRDAGLHLARVISCRLLHGNRLTGAQIGHFERTLRKCLPWIAPFLDEVAKGQFPMRKGRIAAAFGIRERQLERLSKRSLKMSPMEVVRTIRLHRAHEHLLGSTLPVSEIARKAGFSSLSHFSKSFRRQFGQRPTALRRDRQAV